MHIIEKPRPLTANDLKAFREASRATIFHNPYGDNEHRWRGFIGLTREITKIDGHTLDRPVFIERNINIDSTVSTWESGFKDTKPVCSCVYTVSSAHYDNLWFTFIKALRSGDFISATWNVGLYNSDSGIVKAGYQADQLIITIRRPKKDGRFEHYDFCLDIQVAPIDASWRMASRKAILSTVN